MAVIYLKSHVEGRYRVYDGQINDENSKAALGMNLGFDCKNFDRFGCMGYPQKLLFSNKSSRLYYVNILPQFRTNVSLFESMRRSLISDITPFCTG